MIKINKKDNNLTIQSIQDYYLNLGLTGTKLRRAVEQDQGYQRILKQRQLKLGKKYQLAGKSKYWLSTKKDVEIFNKINKLKKKKLVKEDKRLVDFILSQLEFDWRAPMLKTLNKLLKKYK